MPLLSQFKVTLRGVEPPVWRRFLVPADGSFWDLGGALSNNLFSRGRGRGKPARRPRAKA